ncbi:RICIN domain-containing protein [Pseudobacteriovorax antillogorgiicola]|uniref:Uncharacterized protein n=1 Tax=Pseudobacteriovorax antillogorgiicola TaxID=1513793 RepID=A0A1Y6BZW0_9BACT|nr:hypothetical protein [Pseudobacteriovorax antillogorgiicola]TCS53024.1 hypothetical protein EDD56_10875 [Pseudobacteriovorax antillogorgiicola]SMF26838.1 hypothetical protein SAMN06296036_108172 [Pseudobacteriovorax antillogorgiicola]
MKNRILISLGLMFFFLNTSSFANTLDEGDQNHKLAATDYVRIQNFFNLDSYVNIEYGLDASPVLPGWFSAQWVFEKVGSYYRIRNRWRTNHYLHTEYGKLVSGPILPEWLSAQWKVIQESPAWSDLRDLDVPVYRIQNRWQANQYLHMEYGELESGPILSGWWSARWLLEGFGRQCPRGFTWTFQTGPGMGSDPENRCGYDSYGRSCPYIVRPVEGGSRYPLLRYTCQ